MTSIKLPGFTIVILMAGMAFAPAQQRRGPRPLEIPAMVLTSPAFADGTDIPAKYTAAVPNAISPKLEWTNVPDGAESFALIFHDPDGIPRNRSEDYVHWLVFNIPAASRELPEAMPIQAQLPDGAIQCNNRNVAGYIGPGAPAHGPRHHYTFEIFALNTKLDLQSDATRAGLLEAMNGHVLAKGVLIAMFRRQ